MKKFQKSVSHIYTVCGAPSGWAVCRETESRTGVRSKTVYLHGDLTWHDTTASNEFWRSGGLAKKRLLSKDFPGIFKTKREANFWLAKALIGAKR
jgi:hypothetical protein